MAKTDMPLQSVTFTDKAFKSRTIVLPDGRPFAVEKCHIEATDPEVIAYLDKNPEFERPAVATPAEG